MRIAIDIDGVLTNSERYQLDYGSKYCVENNVDFGIYPDEYEIKKIFNWETVKHDEKFWDKYLEKYIREEKARPFASEVIKKLKEDGHEIYILTARNKESKWFPDYLKQEAEEITLNWLKENDIYYDKILFARGKKLEFCLEYEIDIMIEDMVKNVNEISTKLPVICFDNRYNQECKGDNIIRCYSWYDVYRTINKMWLHKLKKLDSISAKNEVDVDEYI